MDAGICHLTVIPMRAEPSHCTEMVSQILFGEAYRVLEESREWVKVSVCHDGYEGWIQRKQHFAISNEQLDNYLQCDKLRLSVPLLIEQPTILSMGAMVPVHPGDSPCPEALPEHLSAEDWSPVADLTGFSRTESMGLIGDAAFSIQGAPYLWGGRTPLGIDCSGFTQLLYSLIGVKLPRDASQQVQVGEPLDFIHEAQLGDLAFFHNEEGRIVHVGMMLNDHEIIHASGYVRVDRVDENGIFNADLQRYTHSLRVVKRIVC